MVLGIFLVASIYGHHIYIKDPMELPAPLPLQISFGLHPSLTLVLCIILSKEGVCKCTGNSAIFGFVLTSVCPCLLASKREQKGRKPYKMQ